MPLQLLPAVASQRAVCRQAGAHLDREGHLFHGCKELWLLRVPLPHRLQHPPQPRVLQALQPLVWRLLVRAGRAGAHLREGAGGRYCVGGASTSGVWCGGCGGWKLRLVLDVGQGGCGSAMWGSAAGARVSEALHVRHGAARVPLTSAASCMRPNSCMQALAVREIGVEVGRMTLRVRSRLVTAPRRRRGAARHAHIWPILTTLRGQARRSCRPFRRILDPLAVVSGALEPHAACPAGAAAWCRHRRTVQQR